MTVVAIDGPAGAGKSTVARLAARELGFTYLDSGAMYRTVALAAARTGRDPADVADEVKIELGGTAPEGRGRVLLDGDDVTDEIRSVDVSEAASRAAADPRVREAMVAQQRRLLARGDWVAEGRDIGTVVAPDAEVKVFLTADPQERARRRAAELGADVNQIAAEQAMRDQRDSDRDVSPLVPAPDAVVLDSTHLSLPEVVAQVVALADSARDG